MIAANNQQNFTDKKSKIGNNLNDNTKELVKQIKKLVVSNKLL